ncbi:MAG: Rpn family recombination-promoting nuclease/putative transposase [Desulfovibrionaceae bacterium]|nr:Rpn family recombination-promoting nuclease/putative transposase [Desulfovibrionaceae bacterium]
MIPIVIYSGTGSWTAKTSCAELCQEVPSALEPYQPNQSYYFVDVIRLVKESVSDKENLAALLFPMEQCKSIEYLIKEI